MSETFTTRPVQFNSAKMSYEEFRQLLITDYKLAVQSRFVSLLGRKEVLTGNAKFGIFGDGKELAQLALAKVFKPGDWRSGYYRDQTLAFALGISSVYHFFSQLYANPIFSSRQLFGRPGRWWPTFSTPLVDSDGEWIDQTQQFNTVSDISTTGGQMARILGLALASKLYRDNPNLSHQDKFSQQGQEVVFCTIGNAATSEGVFWETVNAAGVKQLPVVISIWDDGYGISVQ